LALKTNLQPSGIKPKTLRETGTWGDYTSTDPAVPCFESFSDIKEAVQFCMAGLALPDHHLILQPPSPGAKQSSEET